MILKVKHPEWMPNACESLRKAIDMQQSGVIPTAIQGWMIAVPCKRVLRAVYGSAYMAIWYWLVAQVKEDMAVGWWRIRVKLGCVWMSKGEREIYDEVEREDA